MRGASSPISTDRASTESVDVTERRPGGTPLRARVQLVDAFEARRELFELALGFVGHDVNAGDARSAELDFEHFVPDLVIIAVDARHDDAIHFHHRLLAAGTARRRSWWRRVCSPG